MKQITYIAIFISSFATISGSAPFGTGRAIDCAQPHGSPYDPAQDVTRNTPPGQDLAVEVKTCIKCTCQYGKVVCTNVPKCKNIPTIDVQMGRSVKSKQRSTPRSTTMKPATSPATTTTTITTTTTTESTTKWQGYGRTRRPLPFDPDETLDTEPDYLEEVTPTDSSEDGSEQTSESPSSTTTTTSRPPLKVSAEMRKCMSQGIFAPAKCPGTDEYHEAKYLERKAYYDHLMSLKTSTQASTTSTTRAPTTSSVYPPFFHRRLQSLTTKPTAAPRRSTSPKPIRVISTTTTTIPLEDFTTRGTVSRLGIGHKPIIVANSIEAEEVEDEGSKSIHLNPSTLPSSIQFAMFDSGQFLIYLYCLIIFSVAFNVILIVLCRLFPCTRSRPKTNLPASEIARAKINKPHDFVFNL